MRTTLTIDDDVAEALQREQRRSHDSFKDVVNRALRAGLSLGAEPAQRLPPFKVEAKACGFRPGVDPERATLDRPTRAPVDDAPALRHAPARLQPGEHLLIGADLVDELQADDFLSGEVRRSP